MNYLPEKTIVHQFQEVVNSNPDHIALAFENDELTYREINAQANQLARFLKKKGVMKEEIVGFSVERSFDLVVGILGILKAGAAYLPIDPDYPRERIEYMLKDSGCRFLLTNCASRHNEIEIEVEIIKLSNSDIWKERSDNLVYQSKPSNLAYVIYTSGSTGLPKGVMIEHHALSNFVHAITQEINFLHKTVLSLTSLSFDIFFLETVLPLLKGMKVIIANYDELGTPALLSKLIERHQVNVLQATPSRISALLNNNSKNLLKLSLIIVGGEVFPKSLLLSLRKYTNAEIYNVYGPTETTIWSSIKNLNNSSEITIGKPIGNTSFYILDQHQIPVPVGMPGEIFIAGDSVARGYLNRPELTKERFIDNPFIPDTIMYKTGDIGKWTEDGEVDYIGRNDNQVKIRGFRIELGEIEKCLLKNVDIEQAVVTSKLSNSDRAYLCAFLVGHKELPLSELRQHLAHYLPDYMIPNRFIWLPSLPLTPNGKVDRKSLPDPDYLEECNDKNYVAPRNDIEQKLATFWGEVLEIPRVGIDDDFFVLGGDSLAILEILSSTLPNDWKLSAQEFYEYPTIRELSLVIKARSEITKNTQNVTSEYLLCNTDVLTRYTAQESLGTENVLLTGATGFLGIHILMELLNEYTGKVYCLIRGKDFEHRFKDLFEFYFPEVPSSLIKERVILINGDITETMFGLSEDQYESLGKKVASVIHSAATVKHFGLYSDFETINVKGTKEVIEFCQKYHNHLSHISTISVSGDFLGEAAQTRIFTESDFYIGQDYKSNVYVRSKFEAERLIIEAAGRGLRTTIFRVGILTGRFSDGQFQYNIKENAFYRKIKSIVELRCLPENVFEECIEFTPVDSCAKAIVSILKASSARTPICHLYNHKLLRISDFLKWLEKYGIIIKSIPAREFEEIVISLSQSEDRKNTLSGIIHDVVMNGKLSFSPLVELDSTKTINYLREQGFEWPVLSEEYFRKVISYMKQVDFFAEIKEQKK